MGMLQPLAVALRTDNCKRNVMVHTYASLAFPVQNGSKMLRSCPAGLPYVFEVEQSVVCLLGVPFWRMAAVPAGCWQQCAQHDGSRTLASGTERHAHNALHMLTAGHYINS